HVAGVVARVGEQRQRVGEEAVDRLADHVGAVQRDADGEGAAEIGRRMAVAMVMMAAGSRGVVVMVMMMRHAESGTECTLIEPGAPPWRLGRRPGQEIIMICNSARFALAARCGRVAG